MKTRRTTWRQANPPRVIRTTVGDLVAAAVDAAGVRKAVELFGPRSPLKQLLRERVVVE